MSDSDRIIVKLTSDYPPLFKNINKYVSYLNSIIEDQTQSGQFIEKIEDGLLYIYRDLDTFTRINQPYHPFIPGDQIKKPYIPQKRENFFLKDIIDVNSFPKEGIRLFFETKSLPQQQILSVFENFIKNLRTPGIIISYSEPSKLAIYFTNFDGLEEYSIAVMSLFPKLD
jgi:hypothetical protein